ncbi:hypothetical protein [Streptomyces sp. NPDC088789]|uniref:hypothetical protein n=1 Tax=Streptomyces sp. NPDC088789 TaxID=3365899 RepID=UPI0037F5367A
MTARTAGDRERRRNLADAANTPLTALAGLLRRVPGQQHRLSPLASTEDPPAPPDVTTQRGTER